MVSGTSGDVPLLTLIVHRTDLVPGLTGLCAGYDDGEWRCNQLARHLMRSLPELCLTHSEFAAVNGSNMVAVLEQAAHNLYGTDNYIRRGEFGELLLHVVMRQVFGTMPAISRIYFKDARNDTVKGFDAVHVLPNDSGRLELWLGEAKFYDDIGRAVRDAVDSIRAHTGRAYLKSEFLAIKRKIDPEWPHAHQLRLMLHENHPLDRVVSALVIPTLLTYDSPTLARHRCVSQAYEEELRLEFERHHAGFAGRGLPPEIRVHLFLVPLNDKARLAAALHERLKLWQQL